MLKVSHFAGQSELGPTVVPLYGPGDAELEKVAGATLLPDVTSYISSLTPTKGAQYVLVNAMGAGEYYGCFPAGTLVETSAGEKPIEEVEPGEQVLTHRNRFRPVVARVPKQAEELCDLYVQGLPSNVSALTATPNHELWVVTREDFVQTKRRIVWKGDTSSPLNERREQALKEMEFSWVPIADLRAGDYIAEPFPLEEDPKALGDEKWNCQAVAYLMGLYAAEGCVAYRYDRDDDREASIIYVISGEEQLVLDRARDFAASLGYGLQDYKSESGTSYRLQLCFAELARLCKKHIGTPSTEKYLSPAILRMPKGWQRVFWTAYSSGDGCVRGEGKEEGTIRVVSASAALLRGVRLLLARSGLVASINGRHNKKATWYAGKPIYELALSAGQIRGRGTPKSYLHPDGYILSSVKKVEQYDRQVEVFDLTVEEDSSFVASGVAVHNSNINGDHFPEASLIHAPSDWSGTPVLDKTKGRAWSYGFPTFYAAYPYAHHKNKDPSRAYGEVELACWHDKMKRVELVVRVDHDKCEKFGGMSVWDKLKAGQYPDVSMGSKVPYDTCFPAGTLVRTTYGQKPIEKIQEGDVVATHTGTNLRVTSTMERAADVLVTVRVNGLPDIRATENHPFLVLRREQVRACKGTVDGQRIRHTFWGGDTCTRCKKKIEYELKWVAAESIQVGDYVATPVRRPNETLPISSARARLLGYYLGDGHIIRQRSGKKKYGDYKDMGVGFTVGDGYPEHLERLLATVRESDVANDPRIYDAGDGRNASVVNIYDQELAVWLQDLGGRTSVGKYLRDEVYLWPDEAKMHLLGGIIDTDGSYDDRKGSIRILSSNRGLMLDVHQLLIGLGVHASVSFAGKSSGYGKEVETWQVFIPASASFKFIPYAEKVRGEDPARLSSQTFFWGDYWFAPVRAVELEEHKTRVFNLSVEHDESYIAEGRAVHNCSICLDWELYHQALQTFDPKKHRHAGQAALQFHKKLKAKNGVGIRGLSVTRKDYCSHARTMMNRIFPDGRKVFVYNDFPRFFDISFVFIGADKTAKVMLFIFRDGKIYSSKPSAEVAETLGVTEGSEKTASVSDELLKKAFGKLAKNKKGEIEKKVPTQFASKVVPSLTKNEPDIPNNLLRLMGGMPLEKSLATTAGMGMVLKPREFQRITLIQLGCEDLADDLDRKGAVFEKSDKSEPVKLDAQDFLPALARLLLPLFLLRSGLGPVVERRAVLPQDKNEENEKKASSHTSELLRKIGSAYNGYRSALMDLAAHAPELLPHASRGNDELSKVASADVEEMYTPLTYRYLTEAYLDQFGVSAAGVVETRTATGGTPAWRGASPQ